jgi:tRNA 2-thiouridine synthesizing protein A
MGSDKGGVIPSRLDLTGLKCPLPALRTAKELRMLAPGELLEVHCTDPLSVIDISNLVRETGDTIGIVEQTEQRIVFLIEKANRPIESININVSTSGGLTNA